MGANRGQFRARPPGLPPLLSDVLTNKIEIALAASLTGPAWNRLLDLPQALNEFGNGDNGIKFHGLVGEWHPAQALLQRVQFHYTPKHASWLNMAEIEIGIMDRQCTGHRIATAELLQTEVEQWQQQRNTEGRGIEWKFTRQDADRKLCRHYVS